MQKLITRWGKSIHKNNIHKEYPRPHLVRESYLSLNGEWDYAISKSAQIEHYEGKILVPFSPEAYLSGVEKIVMPDDFLHYRKLFSLPEGFKKDKVILHFEAVDQECTVFFNNSKLGTHKGGYLPFQFDVNTKLLDDTNSITLCVIDKTEASPHARGKQKLVKKGKYGSLFYTPNSGIWKSVWLESVNDMYIEDIRITPHFDESTVGLKVIANHDGTAQLRILDKGHLIKESWIETNVDITIPLGSFRPWTPDEPFLYDIEVNFETDKVYSYFGMRKLSIAKDKNGILRFFLNNKPFFFNGLLDQGYWPESLMTPPSDEALLYDITKTKELGYNTIRKHVKIESERFYYHCDKIGMLVWQDMPNGGGDYNMVFATYLPNAFPWFARNVNDNLYSIFKRKDNAGREQYYEDLYNMVSCLYNHPSIAVWVPFNEGWGQFDARKATENIRKLDTTRLINEACGWFDQQGGDIYSIHNYTGKLNVTPQKDRVVALTEFGGYACPVEGHLACVKEFGYQTYDSIRELTANYKKLFEQEIYPNLENGLCSTIYTQTSDIEEEINGIMTYDREVDKLEAEVAKEINNRLYELFHACTTDCSE